MIGRLWPFILGGVALGLDAYVVAGLLPAIAGSLGTSTALIGMGVAAFTGAYALAGPALAGRAGLAPKNGLTAALFVFSLGNIATAASTNIVLFLIARAVAGAAAGVYSPLSSAVAANLVPVHRRGNALSLVLAGLSTGTVFGVPAGLWVSQVWGWRSTFVLITAIGGLSLIGIRVKGTALPPVPASRPRERLTSITRPANLLSVSVTVATSTASLGLYTYIAFVLADTALKDDTTFGIWVWGIGGALGALGIGFALDRAPSPLRLSLLILAGLMLSFMALPATGSAVVVVVALFFWGLFGWASMAPQQHILMTANPSNGTTAIAANSSANYLGSALGAVLGSIATSAHLSSSGLIGCAAAFVLIAISLQAMRSRLPETA